MAKRLLFDILTKFFLGGMVESERSDHTDATQTRNHPQLTHQSDPRRTKNLEFAYQKRQTRGRRLLYVSNQHGRHEKGARLHHRSRYRQTSLVLLVQPEYVVTR